MFIFKKGIVGPHLKITYNISLGTIFYNQKSEFPYLICIMCYDLICSEYVKGGGGTAAAVAVAPPPWFVLTCSCLYLPALIGVHLPGRICAPLGYNSVMCEGGFVVGKNPKTKWQGLGFGQQNVGGLVFW